MGTISLLLGTTVSFRRLKSGLAGHPDSWTEGGGEDEVLSQVDAGHLEGLLSPPRNWAWLTVPVSADTPGGHMEESCGRS